MKQRAGRTIWEYGIKATPLILAIVVLLSSFSVRAYAAEDKTEIPGKVYTFDKDNHYTFSDSNSFLNSSPENTYGTFAIYGNISNASSKEGVPAYEVAEGNLTLFYDYEDTLLNAGEDSWHLIDDKSKKVDALTLSTNIMKGVIILQTSRDRKTWVDTEIITNAFGDTPIRTSPIYSTTDVQLINGCFYRMIVAYELCIRTEEGNILGIINTDKHDYKKNVEVYEFYAYTNSGEAEAPDLSQTYSLGEKVRVANFDGYFGEETLEKNDIHYGWELGSFFVSGYTDEVKDADGNMVFLKNVGDKVTLWFNLHENINGLNGKDNLTITADAEGYDQYFETPRTDFGRGTLIIRYTDHNNVKATPTIYTNYLEANVTVGADTKVQLFEEGDYEVALDYEVTSDELIDKIGHYRIFFKFSVRNGNCMVYPFDIMTGDELTNSTMTENGFRLDLAKSRYLKVNIKREMLKDSADGLVEDTRFNGPARDGAECTEEGIYTITVGNEYTNQFTVKKIYVGTNDVLRAYMTTGLSIPEINDLVARGATIADDGTIKLANTTLATEQSETTQVTEQENIHDTESEILMANGEKQLTEETMPAVGLPVSIIIGVVLVLICTIGTASLVIKKQKAKRHKAQSEMEGEADK